ncbi:MAG TPA: hypothetical protein HA346_02800 [Thermoplasmata archaeon]|nr:hypothetical protein [Thermoplasmata archaeon]
MKKESLFAVLIIGLLTMTVFGGCIREKKVEKMIGKEFIGARTKVDGNPHHVTFDKYSLIIDGEREFIIGGEFHYFRLPSVKLWRDILTKIKASGYNTVSIYFYWGYHSPAEGVYNFSGIRDIELLLNLCEEIGLYVVARPGPYICAEVDGGGFPGWLLAKGSDVLLRCQYPLPIIQAPILGKYSKKYMEYCEQWYAQIVPKIAEHQITKGGCVIAFQIENEYPQINGNKQYMRELYDMARTYGVNVPIYHNDLADLGSWADSVDIYATDMYIATVPGKEWDSSTFASRLDEQEETQRKWAREEPLFLAEFQGGWFDGWGGVGYDERRDWLNEKYYNIIDKSLIAQGFTIYSHYMFYGGTNWGYWMNPEVYTSYDYGAAIYEYGGISDEYYAMKNIAMLVDAFKDAFVKTVKTENAVSTSNKDVLYKVRTNGETLLMFLRNADQKRKLETKLTFEVDGKSYTIPRMEGTQIVLPERSMKILMANYPFADNKVKLIYSTSEFLTKKKVGDRWVCVIYGDEGSDGETTFKFSGQPKFEIRDGIDLKWDDEDKELQLNYKYLKGDQHVVLKKDNTELCLVITTNEQANRFWVVESDKEAWVIGGPYLTRGLISYGKSAELNVEIDKDSKIVVFSPKDGCGKFGKDDITKSVNLGVEKTKRYKIPELENWKYNGGSPEILPHFDDSDWIGIGKDEAMAMDKHGFHWGYTWYRGYFNSGAKKDLTLEIDARHCYNAYINGKFVGKHDTFNQDQQAAGVGPNAANGPNFPDRARFTIQSSDLKNGKNVVSVLTESLGHNKNFGAVADAKNPRGIISAKVKSGFREIPVKWKIQGDLYGERMGWMELKFDDTDWEDVTLPHTPSNQPCTGWYRAQFELSIPDDLSLPLGVIIEGAHSKANVYLNGYLLGRYWNEKGPQHKFYLPERILNTRGKNVLTIEVWNRGEDAGLGKVYLEPFQLTQKIKIESKNS